MYFSSPLWKYGKHNQYPVNRQDLSGQTARGAKLPRSMWLVVIKMWRLPKRDFWIVKAPENSEKIWRQYYFLQIKLWTFQRETTDCVFNANKKLKRVVLCGQHCEGEEVLCGQYCEGFLKNVKAKKSLLSCRLHLSSGHEHNLFKCAYQTVGNIEIDKVTFCRSLFKFILVHGF